MASLFRVRRQREIEGAQKTLRRILKANSKTKEEYDR
jgi:hypothetical protein